MIFSLPVLRLQIARGNAKVGPSICTRCVAAYFSEPFDGFELFDIQAVFGGVWSCSSRSLHGGWEQCYQVPSLPVGRRGQLAPELNANVQEFPAEYIHNRTHGLIAVIVSKAICCLLFSRISKVSVSLMAVRRYDSNSWAPPMSVQAYRHQNLDNEVEDERGPTPPLRGGASSAASAVPFSQPSSSSLSSSHHEEMQSILQAHLDELTRAYQYEVAKQAW